MKKKLRFEIMEYSLVRNEVTQTIMVDECPFYHVLSATKKVKLIDEMQFGFIVKVTDLSMERKHNIFINGVEYQFYKATPAQMKKNEGYYIMKNFVDEIKRVEEIMSVGLMNPVKNSLLQKPISINKDIIARWSLWFTGTYRTNINYLEDLIVVKDIDCSVFKNVKIFENGKLEDKDNFKIDVTAFDGAGIAGNGFFEKIRKSLGLSYVPAWITFRGSLASKGLLTNVNILQYLEDYHPEAKDENGNFVILDKWGTPRIVTNNTIIVNESCMKWHKWVNSLEEYKERRKQYGYENVCDVVYVAKFAKEKSKEIATTSYQMINMTSITADEYSELAEPTRNFLEKVARFEKEAVLEFLKVIIAIDKQPQSDIEDDDIAVEELADLRDINKADKIQKLLTANFDHFINVAPVKKSLVDMLKKKRDFIASGKVFIKDSSFKVVAPDQLLFLDYCVAQTKANNQLRNLNEVKGGLAPSQFYCKGEVGKRALIRYPLAHPQELSNEILVEAPMYDKYCNLNNEVLVYNQRGIEALSKSGQDFDGDLNLMTSNEIIMNGIIPPKDNRLFINTDDGKQGEYFVLNDENLTYCNLKVSGDLIGNLAMTSSTIGDICQTLEYSVGNEALSKAKIIKEKFGVDSYYALTEKQKVELNNYLNTVARLDYVQVEVQKQYIINKFYKYEAKLCEGVRLQMASIDAPKIMLEISKEEIKAFTEGFENRPMFFRELPDKDSYTYANTRDELSTISRYMIREANNLKSLFEKKIGKAYSEDSPTTMANIFANAKFEVDSQKVMFLSNEIVKSYEQFIRDFNELRRKEEVEIDDEGNKDWVSVYDDNDKKQMIKEIDLKQSKFTDSVYRFHTVEEVCVALNHFLSLAERKSSSKYSRFIIDYHWIALNHMLKANDKIEVLVEDENGTINLFKPYKVVKKKVDAEIFFNNEISEQELQRLNREIKEKDTQIRFRFNEGVNYIPDVVTIKQTATGVFVKDKDFTLGNLFEEYIRPEYLGRTIVVGDKIIGKKSGTIKIKEIRL
ncbi:hypothetical protein ACQPUZ_15435 [Clostridium tertium]